MTKPMSVDADVVRYSRVLPLDIVQAKGAGHAGTAMSLTPALYVLFQEFLRHDPAQPEWRGRDRFVLSCGHASLALYVQLYLSGYGLEMDDLKKARTFGSRTPGHPEFGHTPGVETTTGPLGQGIGNAVGIAMESARMRHILGTELYSPQVWCFASDGDVQEGISHEASALAGTLGLRGLVLIWDDNRISIEGDTAIAFAEDVSARYAAYGWSTLEISDAEDMDEIRRVYAEASDVQDRPVFIRLRSRIGNPMPSHGGTAKAHSGAPGEDEIRAVKEVLGLDANEHFAMPRELVEHARLIGERGAAAHSQWAERVSAWQIAQPESALLLERMVARDVSAATSAIDDLRPTLTGVATRVASSAVLNAVAEILPELWGGSADLAESNGTKISGIDNFLPRGISSTEWPGELGGQLVHFGIREHAMGAILNGIALSGLSRPFGATFFVFSDYMRPSVRLAALMKLPVTYIWSHDSVAVGEDGPTHQPIEHLWSNRAIMGLSVVRPADAIETADAWRRILGAPDGPVALALSRQNLPLIASKTTQQTGAARGAYVAWEIEDTRPDVILIATGSEVSLAIEAAEKLASEKIMVRVISAPCLEWFEAEPGSYREQILPRAVTARVSVEAGTDTGWHKWVGTHGRTVAINGYGQSGAGELVLESLGITCDAVIAAARASIADANGDHNFLEESTR